MEDALIKEQLDLEYQMVEGGKSRFHAADQRALENEEQSRTSYFRRLTKQFIEPFSSAILIEMRYYSSRRGAKSRAWAYLQLLQTTQSAFIAMKVIFDSLTVEQSAQNLLITIGGRIEDQVRFNHLEHDYTKSVTAYVTKVRDNIKKAQTRSYSFKKDVWVHAEKVLSEDSKEHKASVGRWREWSKSDKVHIGAKLLDIFMRNITYKGKPIIYKQVTKDYSSYKGKKNKVVMIRPSKDIVEWVQEFRDAVSELSPLYAPCIIPPLDWTSPFSGGFHSYELSCNTSLIKTSDKRHLAKLHYGQMPDYYDAINHLQKTPWIVDSKTVAVADWVIRKDKALGMPSSEPIRPGPAPVPLKYSLLKGQELKKAMNLDEWYTFKNWKIRASECYDADIARKCKYLESARTVGQALKYLSYDALYFIFTGDFRSRVYNSSSLLSNQGSDIQKGLITFKNKYPLREEGKYWLAVEGADRYGYNKREVGKGSIKTTFDERVAFIDSLEQDILMIATDPQTFTSWASVDKPWQFLTWCFEWARLHKWEASGMKAEDFESNCPCYHDGACSGIQHYSAMLRDPVGGKSVNLVPGDRPRDIYANTAGLARQRLEAIAKGFIPYKNDGTRIFKIKNTELIAISRAWLELGITRDMTKVPTMTVPYNSTRRTCRKSIDKYLNRLQNKEDSKANAQMRIPIKAYPFSKKKGTLLNRTNAETVATNVVWDSISDVVIGARVCMNFISDVTNAMTKRGKWLEWTTPVGFIVKQLIWETKEKRIETKLCERTDFVLREPINKIDKLKMKSSAAPNFVHSMDASHLVLVVNALKEQGITDISCIHDSFGVHAGRVPILRKILNRTFVDMYEENDVLERFKVENETRILEVIDVETPQPLGLDLQVVLKSTYLFG